MRENAGYKIIQSIKVKENEIVLGESIKSPSQYVTWECSNGDNYYWGHYFNDLLDAQDDFCMRSHSKIEEYRI